jgi:hypothetical protein
MEVREELRPTVSEEENNWKEEDNNDTCNPF